MNRRRRNRANLRPSWFGRRPLLVALILALAASFLLLTDAGAQIREVLFNEVFHINVKLKLVKDVNSGDGQTAFAGLLSDTPIRTKVVDEGGRVVRGAQVDFIVVSRPDSASGGSVTSPDAISDVNGIASTHFIAGTVPGVYLIHAIPAGADFLDTTPLVFSIRVVPPPPLAVRLSRISSNFPPTAFFEIDLPQGAIPILVDALDGKDRPLALQDTLWAAPIFPSAGGHNLAVHLQRGADTLATYTFDALVDTTPGFFIDTPLEGYTTSASNVDVFVDHTRQGFTGDLTSVAISVDGGEFQSAALSGGKFTRQAAIGATDGAHILVAKGTTAAGATILSPPRAVNYIDTRFVNGFRDGNLGTLADPDITTLSTRTNLPGGAQPEFLQKELFEGITPYHDYFQNNIESVEPYSGNLVLRQTDLELPGRGGFDLVITRIYNQNAAYAQLYKLALYSFLHDAQAIQRYKLSKFQSLYGMNLAPDVLPALDQSISELRTQARANPPPLGIGWMMDFPSFDASRNILTYAGGSKIPVTFNSAGKFNSKGFTFDFQRTSSGFSLTEKDGRSYLFNGAGTLQFLKDRTSNNIITFLHRQGTKYPDQQLLYKIIDTVKREVLLTYDSEDRLTELRLGDRVIKRFHYNDGIPNRTIQGGVETFGVPQFFDKSGTLANWPLLTRVEDAKGRFTEISYSKASIGSSSIPKSWIDAGYVASDSSDQLNGELRIMSRLSFPLQVGAYVPKMNELFPSRSGSEDFNSDNFTRTRNSNFAMLVSEVKYPTGGSTAYAYSSQLSERMNYSFSQASPVTVASAGQFTMEEAFLWLNTQYAKYTFTTRGPFTQAGFRVIAQTRKPGGISYLTNYSMTKTDTRVKVSVVDSTRRVEYEYIGENDPRFAGHLLQVSVISNTFPNFGKVMRKQEFISDEYKNTVLEINYQGDDIQPSTPPAFFVRYGFATLRDRELRNPTSISKVRGDGTPLQTVIYKYHPVFLNQITEISGDVVHSRFVFDDEGSDPGGVGLPTNVQILGEDGTAVSETRKRYDKYGQLMEATDPLGGHQINEYYEDFQLVKSSVRVSKDGTLLSMTKYDYDFLPGLVTRATDALGNTTFYDYDILYRHVLTRNPDGTTGRSIYRENVGGDPENNQVEVIDERGNHTLNVNDGLGRLTRIERFLAEENRSLVERATYDARGNIQVLTDATGLTTSFLYDALGRKIKTTVAGLPPEQTQYFDDLKYGASGHERKIVHTDRRGFQKEIYLDGLDHLASMIQFAGANAAQPSTMTFEYDRHGNVVTVHDANGHVSRMAYSPQEKVASMTDPAGNSTQMRYDPAGNNTRTIDARGNAVVRSFDNFGDLTDIVTKAGSNSFTHRMVYDLMGRKSDDIDENGHTSHFDYDVRGRLAVAKRVVSGPSYSDVTTRREYDERGNLTLTIDGKGNAVSFNYDSLNRLVRRIVEMDGNPAEVTAADLVTEFQYNDRGQPLMEIAPNGNRTASAYDALGRLIGIVQKAQNLPAQYLGKLTAPLLASLRGSPLDVQVITYEYDNEGNRVAEIDPLGNATRLQYDGLGRVIVKTNPLGQTERFEYDPVGNRISATDIRGNVTRTFYDSLNRVVRIERPLGAITVYVYDAVGNLVEEQVKKGAAFLVTHLVYDELNRLVERRDPAGHIERYTFDGVGNRTARVDPNGNTFTFRYDELNRTIEQVQSLISPSGPIERRSAAGYDRSGNVIDAVDFLGQATVFSYDQANRLISRRDAGQRSDFSTPSPADRITQYRYDKIGSKILEVSPAGEATSFAYSPLGQLLKVIQRANKADAAGNTSSSPNDIQSQIVYDRAGRPVREIDALSHETAFEYDKVGRMVKTTDPLGNATSAQFNDVGGVTTVTDAEGNRTDQVLDALNRVARIVQYFKKAGNDPVTTEYQYDEMGNRTAEIYPINGISHTTTLEYDNLGRLAKEHWIDATGDGDRTTELAYDNIGNVVRMIRPDNSVVERTYTQLDKPATLSVNGNVLQRYQYDLGGNLTNASGDAGNVDRSYDGFGRMTREVQSRAIPMKPSWDIRYEYDAGDRRTKMTVLQPITGADTMAFEYRIDNFGRTSRIANTANGLAATYRYDKLSRLVQKQNPDQTYTNYNYDPASRLKEINTFDRQNNAIDALRYDYDRVGNVVSKSASDGTEAYQYDDLYRLARVQYANGQSEAFRYDAFGNRLERIINDATHELYTYNGRNELTRMTRDSAVTSFSYDLRGNMTGKVVSNSVDTSVLPRQTHYAFDALDRLTSMTAPNGNTVTNGYDPLGRRISRTDGANSTRYVLDGSDVLAEINDANTNLLREYVNGVGIDNLVGMVDRTGASPLSVAFHQEANNSIRSVRNVTDGAEVASYRYGAFGDIRAKTGSTPEATPRAYTGRELESRDAGGDDFYYYRARFYGSGTGRFASRDPVRGSPLNPQTLNRYVYAAANPATYTDPMGNNYNDYGGSGNSYFGSNYAGNASGGGSRYTFGSSAWENAYNSSASSSFGNGYSGNGSSTAYAGGYSSGSFDHSYHTSSTPPNLVTPSVRPPTTTSANVGVSTGATTGNIDRITNFSSGGGGGASTGGEGGSAYGGFSTNPALNAVGFVMVQYLIGATPQGAGSGIIPKDHSRPVGGRYADEFQITLSPASGLIHSDVRPPWDNRTDLPGAGDDFESTRRLGNRLQGGLRAVGGIAGVTLAGLSAEVTGPLALGLGIYELSETKAGFKSMWSGEYEQSAIEFGMSNSLQSFTGMSRRDADEYAGYGNAFLGLGLNYSAGRSLNFGRRVETAEGGTVRVGRWMSESEHEAMVTTGKVQQGPAGITSASSPPEIEFWRRRVAGTRHVEFDVSKSAIHPSTGGPNIKIYGPDAKPYADFYGITEMPNAGNILMTGEKLAR